MRECPSLFHAVEYRAVDRVGGFGAVAIDRDPNQLARIAIVFLIASVVPDAKMKGINKVAGTGRPGFETFSAGMLDRIALPKRVTWFVPPPECPPVAAELARVA